MEGQKSNCSVAVLSKEPATEKSVLFLANEYGFPTAKGACHASLELKTHVQHCQKRMYGQAVLVRRSERTRLPEANNEYRPAAKDPPSGDCLLRKPDTRLVPTAQSETLLRIVGRARLVLHPYSNDSMGRPHRRRTRSLPVNQTTHERRDNGKIHLIGRTLL